MSNYSITELAEIASKHFTTIVRDGSNDRIVILKEDTPEWIHDVVREAHGSSFPDDLIYEHICNVIDALANDGDDPQETVQEMEPDAYTSDLIKWLASDVSYVDYMTQAIEEYGAKDGFAVLATAQKIWMDEIGYAVINALEAVDLPDPLTPEEQTEAIRNAVASDPDYDFGQTCWYLWTYDGSPQSDLASSGGETDSEWPALPYKHYDL